MQKERAVHDTPVNELPPDGLPTRCGNHPEPFHRSTEDPPAAMQKVLAVHDTLPGGSPAGGRASDQR